MNFSRLLPALKGLALMFAANEVAAATPHVQKAIGELPADLKAADPIGAFVTTAKNAYEAIKADPNMQTSLTGLLGAVASAFTSALFDSGAPAASDPAQSG